MLGDLVSQNGKEDPEEFQEKARQHIVISVMSNYA
jgi:hypothetical protein